MHRWAAEMNVIGGTQCLPILGGNRAPRTGSQCCLESFVLKGDRDLQTDQLNFQQSSGGPLASR